MQAEGQRFDPASLHHFHSMISSSDIHDLFNELSKKSHLVLTFKESKRFFSKFNFNPDFNYEDLEVIKYLLKDSMVKTATQGLKLIERERLSFCYKQIEKKIPLILLTMEREGILINQEKLKALDLEIESKIKDISSKIFELSGEEFNLNSPKQVNEVLFTKLGLKSSKKTAGGELSTSSDVLEDLALQGIQIAQLLIESRYLYKLKNTYTSVLMQKSGESIDARIRTTFSSTSTLTGRLNSKNPNLQNLPVTTGLSIEVRDCFIAKTGFKLVSFDYSQIELRLLSHIANIKPLKDAFILKEDIHKSTASVMFQIPLEHVTKEERDSAKAINFGIIYGLSAFALAKTLKISTTKAAEYMEQYFEKYHGIKEYMEETMNFAKENKFVRTLSGKKCYIEGLDSPNFSIRSHALRSSINARIQGSGADLIKKAMVDIFEHKNLLDTDCKLILQIHDELIFEVKEELVEEKSQLIKQLMENAFRISVPITVNQKIKS